jgi:urease accessory protein UreE
MLPQRAERRNRIYRTILDQGAELHLVLEDIVVRRMADTLAIEEVLSVVNWLPKCLTRIPDCTS